MVLGLLANAVPLAGDALPDLFSWRIGLPDPVRAPRPLGAAYAVASAPAGVGDEAGDLSVMETTLEDVDFMSEVPEAAFREAEQRDLPHAFEYTFAQPVELVWGDGETLLPLFTRDLDGEFYHYTVPRSEPRTYLVCRAEPDGALLAGRLNVHFDGRFVGSSGLKERRAGEDLLLNLGVDRGVSVTRENITDRRTETFFGVMDRSSVGRELEYRIRIENTKKEAVSVRSIRPARRTVPA